jgi:hypothetical protein
VTPSLFVEAIVLAKPLKHREFRRGILKTRRIECAAYLNKIRFILLAPLTPQSPAGPRQQA